LPKTVFPGGALVGCNAGYLNVGRIKGSHAAIKTGMLAAEAAYEAIVAGRAAHDELSAYPAAFKASWLHTELNKDRNFKNWFEYGLTTATLMNGFEQFVLRGHIRWTLRRDKPDHAYLKPAAECQPVQYPKPDGKLTFDRLSSVFISNTNHEEQQPAHLTLKDASVPVPHRPRPNTPAPRPATAPLACTSTWKNDDDADRLQIDAQELRALQDLRHQGSDAKHRPGPHPRAAAGGWTPRMRQAPGAWSAPVRGT